MIEFENGKFAIKNKRAEVNFIDEEKDPGEAVFGRNKFEKAVIWILVKAKIWN